MSRFIKVAVFLVSNLLFTGLSYAQLEITFPAERAVFQRDNQNNGFVTISGIASKEATVIEAKLTPVVAGQGTETDWQLIDDQLIGGSFSGQISGKGGWYKLQVRAFSNGNLLSISVIEKVGIGEVFVISGQSNAQGFLRFNPKGSVDDRVNGYGFYKADFIDENATLTDIRHIDRELNIGPHGQSAWAWGELGDKLAAKYNVPVLFFNTAYEGTLIENWVKSSRGETTQHQGYGFTFTGGAPYSFLKIILQNHVNIYGMRSIIWIQGESDYQTDGDIYYANLKYFVNKVGSDVGKTIPWIVTKTSLNFNLSFDKILFAQGKVINELPNVFSGPLTDYVGIPRYDGVHLFNNGFLDGISELAEALNGTLNQNLLNQMTPIQGNPILPLNAVCVSGGNARVSLKDKSTNTPSWSNGVKADVIQLSSGRISAKVKDANGNTSISEVIEVKNIFPSAPVISSQSQNTICEGSTATFTADRTDYKITWQDGSEAAIYTATTTEDIYARYTNAEGCISPLSNQISLRVVANPSPPVLTSANGNFGECEGGAVILNAQSSAAKVIWSDGSEGVSKSVSGVGNFIFSAKAETPEGCSSPFSDEVEVNIYPKPAPPTITQNGPYSVGVVNDEVYESYIWKFEGQLLEGENSNQVAPPSNGFLNISGYERHQAPFAALCLSNDSGLLFFEKVEDAQGLVVYPSPPVDNKVYLTSDQPIDLLSIGIFDTQGKAVVRSQQIRNVNLPYEFVFDQQVFHGFYIMVVNYDGLEKRFRLFFE
ncbi:sialate O-acetylesterase [Jiulongibacter sediminis]|jgi:hypothetical protein|uniref:sialate O-acetylesterase n=1 Tax=Jiulongibacter sediminis TaxID=1605367 RepID=UPI0026EA6023|nr:sialate O-acetylesterase [Jiulongibacter sediminis]